MGSELWGDLTTERRRALALNSLFVSCTVTMHWGESFEVTVGGLLIVSYNSALCQDCSQSASQRCKHIATTL